MCVALLVFVMGGCALKVTHEYYPITKLAPPIDARCRWAVKAYRIDDVRAFMVLDTGWSPFFMDPKQGVIWVKRQVCEK